MEETGKSVNVLHHSLACVAAVSFPFPGGDQTSEPKAGERKNTPGVSKKLGRSGEGVREREGGGGGEKIHLHVFSMALFENNSSDLIINSYWRRFL